MVREELRNWGTESPRGQSFQICWWLWEALMPRLFRSWWLQVSCMPIPHPALSTLSETHSKRDEELGTKCRFWGGGNYFVFPGNHPFLSKIWVLAGTPASTNRCLHCKKHTWKYTFLKDGEPHKEENGLLPGSSSSAKATMWIPSMSSSWKQHNYYWRSREGGQGLCGCWRWGIVGCLQKRQYKGRLD